MDKTAVIASRHQWLRRSVLACTALVLAACGLLEPPDRATIEGRVLFVGDSAGVAGVTVDLVNADVKVDTLTFKGPSALQDSAVTDANGGFRFSALRPGRYGVHPVRNSRWWISAVDTADAGIFSLKSGETKTITYFAEPYARSGFGGTNFVISWKNLRLRGTDHGQVGVHVMRREWILFVPYLKHGQPFASTGIVSDGGGLYTVTSSGGVMDAVTVLFWSLDNYFRFSLFTTYVIEGAPLGYPDEFDIYLPFTIPFSRGDRTVRVTRDALTRQTTVSY